jgi:hypothetical protein
MHLLGVLMFFWRMEYWDRHGDIDKLESNDPSLCFSVQIYTCSIWPTRQLNISGIGIDLGVLYFWYLRLHFRAPVAYSRTVVVGL